MLYLSALVWVIVIVLLAWGVNRIWLGMAKPKAINTLLLPGTIVSSIGRTIALLITGATWGDASKVAQPGKPPVESGPQPKMPVLGPIIVAAIPLLMLGVLLHSVMIRMGAPVIAQISQNQVAKDLPLNLAGFWEQLRTLVTLSEKTLDAVRNAEATSWRTFFFVYLMVCLTVRLAPFPGNVRGHLVALLAMGAIASLAGTMTPRLEEIISASWPLLSLTVGWMVLLLMASLLAKAVVTSARSVIKWD